MLSNYYPKIKTDKHKIRMDKLFDISKYPDDLHSECVKRNKELSLEILKCVKSDDIKHLKPKYFIKYVEWEGLFCYENKNCLNMSDLDLKTFLIKGKNGTGKSAIYDILTLAIWGEITTLKKSSLSSGILNYKIKNAYTIVDIEIDDILYRIERDFTRNKDNNSTASLVVPSASSTKTLGDPAKTLSKLDFPTLGRPTKATLLKPSSTCSEPTSGNWAMSKSSKSPLPRPCNAETNLGSPKPRFHKA